MAAIELGDASGPGSYFALVASTISVSVQKELAGRFLGPGSNNLAPGLIHSPAPLGIELFLVANGVSPFLGDQAPLDPNVDLSFSMDVPPTPNSYSIEQAREALKKEGETGQPRRGPSAKPDSSLDDPAPSHRGRALS